MPSANVRCRFPPPDLNIPTNTSREVVVECTPQRVGLCDALHMRLYHVSLSVVVAHVGVEWRERDRDTSRKKMPPPIEIEEEECGACMHICICICTRMDGVWFV